MASTYKVQQAVDIVAATSTTKGQENLHTAADLALAYMWMKYPWPQSLEELPPFWLVPERAEYGSPLSVIPSDFSGLWEVHLLHVRGDGSGPHYIPIIVMKHTSQTRTTKAGSIWPPSSISYIPEFAAYRLSAPTPSNIAGPEYAIVGSYKKNPTKITAANIDSTLIPFDDKHFGAFVEMVRWKLMELNGDPRAGGVQVFPNGARQYSGQAGIAHDAVIVSIADEDDDGGSDQIQPANTWTDW